MLKTRIIPCLDVKNGRVVKGINFENIIDAGDPVLQAEYYYKAGADEICFLDIAASQENRDTMFAMVKKVASTCFIPFTVGGGIREMQDFLTLMRCGADKVSVNSAAINNPNLITQAANKFGSQCVVVAIDAKKTNNGYEVFSHGGTKSTNINAVNWAMQVQSLGAGEILLTSMDKDGTKTGYDLDLLQKISQAVSIPVIASGGVGCLQDFKNGLKSGASALLAASIFHFQQFSIKQVKDFLCQEGFVCR